MPGKLVTIGHSSHSFQRFASLLVQNGVTALADVRSTPLSSYNPQFNRDQLAASLREIGIPYVFLGDELGARRREPECYRGNRVSFLDTARSSLFARGLQRVAEGLVKFNVALMCAEKEPLECHRSALICRHGEHRIGRPGHIRDDGTIESHDDLETRLLALADLPESDLFRSREDRLTEAYAWLEQRVAYRKPDPADRRPSAER